MGCFYSRIQRQEMVSRCKARKKYMKQFVKARQAFSAAHSMYLRSLRTTGAALLQFATGETNLHHHRHHSSQNHHLPPPLPPSPPPPPIMSTSSETATTTTGSSTIRPPPPPPPPPVNPPSAPGWDFWDPFMPYAGRSVDEEEWEETTTGSEVASTVPPPPPSAVGGFTKYTAARSTTTTVSSELAVVPTTKSKDLVEIIKELDDYFLRAADACAPVSLQLGVPTGNFSDQRSSGKDYRHGKSLSPLLWTWGSTSTKWGPFGKYCEDPVGNIGGCTSNCSTVEKLYAWEKKLYDEVKNSETMKLEHDKKVAHLRKLEMNRADYVKTEKAKKEVEKLESHILVASQSIETTSAEIVKLRESELYPQLVELIKGLTSMWRRMYECHQVQTDIVEQLKYLNCIPSTDPTSELHRQATLQLEVKAQQWHISFSNLVKAQHDYIQSLTGWLRLSLFDFCNKPVRLQDSAIYSLCDTWQRAITNIPDKVASEGIKSFLGVINAIVEKQGEEQKQKKRTESSFKEHEKKVAEVRSVESKYGPYSMSESRSELLRVKRMAVEASRAKAEDEKNMYEKAIGVTRSMTLNSLQMGLPRVFQALTGFANVCTQAFESVQNGVEGGGNHNGLKLILP